MTESLKQQTIRLCLIHTTVSKFANMPFSLYSCFHSNNTNSKTYDAKRNSIARGCLVQIERADWKQK